MSKATKTTAAKSTKSAKAAAPKTDTTVIAGPDTTATAAPATPKVKAEKPKYLVQREKRQRFSFGNTWLNAVLAGVVTDRAKLEAHGVKVNAGTAAELSELTFEALLEKVQTAILNEPAPQPEPEVEAEAPVVASDDEDKAPEVAPEVEVEAAELVAA